MLENGRGICSKVLFRYLSLDRLSLSVYRITACRCLKSVGCVIKWFGGTDHSTVPVLSHSIPNAGPGACFLGSFVDSVDVGVPSTIFVGSPVRVGLFPTRPRLHADWFIVE